MKLEKVIDVVFEHLPDNILIYLKDKELFNGDFNALKCSNYLENLNVYSYEYLDKNYNTTLIRVMEVIK